MALLKFQSLLGRLASQPCLLCQASTADGRPLCLDCLAELPAIETACQRCGLPLPTAAMSCGQCLNSPPRFHSCTAFYQYQQPLDYLITRFKHHHDRAAQRAVTHLFEHGCARTQPLANAADYTSQVVVPTPLHWKKLWKRGFNQSYILAKIAAAQWQLPLVTIKRNRGTPSQQGLSRKQRTANLRSAFSTEADFTGARVLVVDDVVTTGATADALATCLLGAGAHRVDILALARTPSPQQAQAFGSPAGR